MAIAAPARPQGRPLARRGGRLAAGAALLALAAAVASPAPGQCILTAGPNRLDPGPDLSPGWGLKPDYLKLYQLSGARRLVARATYGYVVYDLTSPADPPILAAHDIHSAPGYERHGDGQTTVNAVGVAADGSRLLVGYNDTHGTLVMPSSGPIFTFGGDFAPVWTGFGGGLAVARTATRSIAFAAPPGGSLYLADVTTPLTGSAAQTPLAFPREPYTGAPNARASNTLRLVTVGTKQYLVYPTTAGTVVVADVSNPGPVGSISSGFSRRTFTPAELGFPAGVVAGTVEPFDVGGELHLAVEGTSGLGGTKGVSLVKATLSGVVGTPKLYAPPAPYSGSGSQPGSAISAVPLGSGSLVFFWELGSNGLLKLFTLATTDWAADLTPGVTFTPGAPNEPGTEAMAAFSVGDDAYLYAGDSGKAVALRVSCVPACPGPTTLTHAPAAPAPAEPVDFTCTATVPAGQSISSYDWLFSDGLSTSTVVPTYRRSFAAAGTYVARCTARCSGGGSQVAEATLTASCAGVGFGVADDGSGLPIAEDPLVGLPVLSGQLLEFASAEGSTEWTFGDGGTATANPVSRAYGWTGAYPKSYTARLTRGSCQAEKRVTVTPVPPSIASLSVSPPAPAVSETAHLTCSASAGSGGSIVRYDWTLGDGQTAQTAAGALDHAYGAAGVYTAACTAVDAAGQAARREAEVAVGSGAPTGTSFFTVAPCRAVDTRAAEGERGGPALVPGARRSFPVTGGACGIPSSARAISANVTVTGGVSDGYVTLTPASAEPGGTSSLNFRASQTRANNLVLRLAADGSGTVAVLAGTSGGVHLVLDVNGYFE